MDRVARGDPDVGARPLEAGEGVGEVAERPEVARRDALPGVAEQRVMAEVVADLEDAAGVPTWSASRAAASEASVSGFSQNTSRPAASAAAQTSACCGVGVRTSTTST